MEMAAARVSSSNKKLCLFVPTSLSFSFRTRSTVSTSVCFWILCCRSYVPKNKQDRRSECFGSFFLIYLNCRPMFISEESFKLLTSSHRASRCRASSFWVISRLLLRNQPSKLGDLRKCLKNHTEVNMVL